MIRRQPKREPKGRFNRSIGVLPAKTISSTGKKLKRQKAKTVRYAIVGMGHIAQIAVLPAFKHASNSKLVALVSGERIKLRELGRRYRVPILASYDKYD